MVRTHKEVPKRARNSINCQVDKLIKKYGEKEVRLVITKLFSKTSRQRQLEKQIEAREEELKKLRKGLK